MEKHQQSFFLNHVSFSKKITIVSLDIPAIKKYKSTPVFAMLLFSIDFSLLFLTFLDRLSSAAGGSLIAALEIFLKVLFFPTFFAKFITFLNVLLKPLPPCLTRRLWPLGAALCL